MDKRDIMKSFFKKNFKLTIIILKKQEQRQKQSRDKRFGSTWTLNLNFTYFFCKIYLAVASTHPCAVEVFEFCQCKKKVAGPTDRMRLN